MPIQRLLPGILFGAATVLEELAALMASQLAEVLARMDTTGGVVDGPTAHNLAQIAAAREQIARIAEEQGLQLVVDSLRAELPAVVAGAIADYPDLGSFGVDVTGDVLRVLDGVELEVTRVLALSTPDAVAEAVRASLAGAVSMDELNARAARALDTSLGRAVVTIERGVRDVHEAVLWSQALGAPSVPGFEDEWVFVYEGPQDSRNRPYCSVRVNTVMTAEQARDHLDPRERYNCRHIPTPRLLSEVAHLPRFDPAAALRKIIELGVKIVRAST